MKMIVHFHRRCIRQKDGMNRNRFQMMRRIHRCKRWKLLVQWRKHRMDQHFRFRIQPHFHLSNWNNKTLLAHNHQLYWLSSFLKWIWLTRTEENGLSSGINLRDGHQDEKGNYLKHRKHFMSNSWFHFTNLRRSWKCSGLTDFIIVGGCWVGVACYELELWMSLIQ